MSALNRWKERRGAGQFQARSELSSQQQTLLAAVPRWKLEHVRPASLKPHQSPKFLVKKWVIDTSSERSSGTVEEMAEALKTVVAVNLGGAGIGKSGSATPAALEDDSEVEKDRHLSSAKATAEPKVGSASNVTSLMPSEANSPAPLPPVAINPAKPSSGPASSPDLSLPPANDAVLDLQHLPTVQPAGDDDSAMRGIVEDEVQLAEEAMGQAGPAFVEA